MKTDSPSTTVTEARRHQSEREQTYREQALAKLAELLAASSPNPGSRLLLLLQARY